MTKDERERIAALLDRLAAKQAAAQCVVGIVQAAALSAALDDASEVAA